MCPKIPKLRPGTFSGRTGDLLRRIIPLAVMSLPILSVGCQNSSSDLQPANRASAAVRETPTGYTLLKRSARNFNFLVVQGGTVALYDTTADKLVLRTQLPPNTMFQVDATNGVYVNGNKVVNGPLPTNNTRELRLEN